MSDEEEATGRAKGGFARAERLSAKERSSIAREAARKRWEARRPSPDAPYATVLHRGILNLGGLKLPCAVVEGPNGIQRVISETGITRAVLGTRSGASRKLAKAAASAGTLLPVFLAPPQLKPFIDAELEVGTLNPVEWVDGAVVVRGFDASILPAVCNVWLKAREARALLDRQLPKAQKAEILTRALAETGVVALIDEATGYEKVRPQNALQAYLEKVIRRELAAWAKRFPDEFWENIYKLKGWPWMGMKKNRYPIVARYVRDLVYERLGPGVLQELERKTPKNEKGHRSNKLHQWLTDDVGHPMLAQHLHSLIMFQRLAIASGFGWQRFYNMVEQVMPKRNANLELPFGEPIASWLPEQQSPPDVAS